MKNIKYLLVLILFLVFNIRVYAFSYEMELDAGNTSVDVGTVTEVDLILKNIDDNSSGVIYCDFEIHTTGGVKLKELKNINNDWKMQNNGFYIFSATKPIIHDSRLFRAKIEINGFGSFNVIDIKCQNNVNFVLSTSDLGVKFKINDSVKAEEENFLIDKIVDIQLSDGKINFDRHNNEYVIKVTDFEKLKVTPVVMDDSIRYSVSKETLDDVNYVYVDFIDVDGSNVMYIIKVIEKKIDSLCPIIIIILLGLCLGFLVLKLFKIKKKIFK